MLDRVKAAEKAAEPAADEPADPDSTYAFRSIASVLGNQRLEVVPHHLDLTFEFLNPVAQELLSCGVFTIAEAQLFDLVEEAQEHVRVYKKGDVLDPWSDRHLRAIAQLGDLGVTQRLGPASHSPRPSPRPRRRGRRIPPVVNVDNQGVRPGGRWRNRGLVTKVNGCLWSTPSTWADRS